MITMNQAITIKKLTLAMWEQYKKLRLQALATEPQAFGASYEKESTMTDDEWKEKVTGFLTDNRSPLLLAIYNDQLVGMIQASFESNEKFRHIAHLFSFYINPVYRGKHIGKLLLTAILAEIQKRRGIIKVKLNVNPNQESAVHLYESFGFNITGKSEKEIRIGNSFYDQYYMEKFL